MTNVSARRLIAGAPEEALEPFFERRRACFEGRSQATVALVLFDRRRGWAPRRRDS